MKSLLEKEGLLAYHPRMPKSAKQSGRKTAQKRAESEPAKSDWTPSEQERAALQAYSARLKRDASVAPRIKISKGDTSTKVSLDHPKAAVGYALFAQAFGVTSLNMSIGLIDQLVGASHRNGNYDEQSTNFMAAVIESIKPRDELEAMLAAQMAAVHVAAMTFARRLAGVENIPQQDSAERAFNKLTRTFTTQLEAALDSPGRRKRQDRSRFRFFGNRPVRQIEEH